MQGRKKTNKHTTQKRIIFSASKKRKEKKSTEQGKNLPVDSNALLCTSTTHTQTEQRATAYYGSARRQGKKQ